MSWTEDRVSRLAKLWAEGLSASQIAADLGGVTRNAVIGKVHRLGLSGRAKPAGKSNAAPRRKPSSRSNGSTYSKPRATPRNGGDTAVKIAVQPVVQPEPPVDLVAPVSRKLTLMELSETTCKWPTGDPTMPGFSFCGHTSNDDKPYCEFHNKLAFQPPSERRRRR